MPVPTAREKAASRVASRDAFIEALADYIDARIHYAAADPEWRNSPAREEQALELALDRLLGEVIP